MRVRALVPPLTLIQSGTILCPLHTKQASPHYSRGSADSHGFPIATRNVPNSHWSKTMTTARTPITLVCSPHRVTPHQADPLPDTQNAQATIRKPGFHTKQDPFLQKQFPISDSSHGEQPFLGCASPQTPRGPKPRGSPTQRRASYKPCSSRQPRPPPTLADLTAAKARNPWVRKRTPPHKRGVLPGDPRKTLSAPGPVPALPRPGAPRSPALLLLLPAWQALQLLGPQRLHLVQQTALARCQQGGGVPQLLATRSPRARPGAAARFGAEAQGEAPRRRRAGGGSGRAGPNWAAGPEGGGALHGPGAAPQLLVLLLQHLHQLLQLPHLLVRVHVGVNVLHPGPAASAARHPFGLTATGKEPEERDAAAAAHASRGAGI